MNFLNTLSQLKTLAGGMLSSATTPSTLDSGAGTHPVIVVYGRYLARFVILGIALFIFAWWPVDDFTTKGFDAWSKRMSNLPQPVWYLFGAIIASWGTTEVMAARATAAIAQNQAMNGMIPPAEGEDFMADPVMDGRFANLGADQDMFQPNPAAINPVIENWRNNAAG